MSAFRRPRLRPILYLSLLGAGLILLAVSRWGPAAPAGARGQQGSLQAASAAAAAAKPPAGSHWLAAWGASPQAATTADEISERGFRAVTLREIVFVTASGPEVRVRFTNAFGTRPLEIGRAAVATAASGAALIPGSSRQLMFSGRSPSVVVPAGATVLSDPVTLPVRPLDRLAVSVYLPHATGPTTQHVGAHETNYEASGSHILDPGSGPFASTLSSWFFLSGLEVLAPRRDTGAVVALGDSITAGVGSTPNADDNWPDDLARRLAAQPGSTMSVVDAGIGGNRILNPSPCCGPSAVTRFRSDVTDQKAARDVILLEGVNDIGYSRKRGALYAPHTDVSARQIINGDERIIALAHGAGLRILGATITPFKGARYWTAAGEVKREAVNQWILHSSAFDAVVDFAGVLAEPGHPERLRPAYDSGDHLHPDDAGYRAMAGSVNLALLR